MKDKTKTDIKTFSITRKGIDAMLEYEKKLICKVAIAFSVIALIAVLGIFILLSIAK